MVITFRLTCLVSKGRLKHHFADKSWTCTHLATADAPDSWGSAALVAPMVDLRRCFGLTWLGKPAKLRRLGRSKRGDQAPCVLTSVHTELHIVAHRCSQDSSPEDPSSLTDLHISTYLIACNSLISKVFFRINVLKVLYQLK